MSLRVSGESVVRQALRRQGVLGSVVWAALVLASFLPGIHIGIIEVLFLLAPWIVVPLGAALLSGPDGPPIYGAAAWILSPAAALATVSFFVKDGVVAACFAGAWFLLCAAFAWDGLRRLLRSRAKSFAQFCFAVGEGYLLVAGVWLVASRAGIQFIGFREPIVLLTAVHFHFAGFASAVFAGLTYERFRGSKARGPLRAALLAVVCGPGILGVAFLAGPSWKLFAALLISTGQLGLAAGMIRVALASGSGIGRWFLIIAGGSVLVGMVLAAAWAVGEYPLQPFVNIRQMAEFHGVLNAVGFVLCGSVGWERLRPRNSGTGP